MAVLVSGGASYIASAAATTTANILPTRPSVVGGLLYQSVAYDSGRSYILPNALTVPNKSAIPMAGIGAAPMGYAQGGSEYYNVILAEPTLVAAWPLNDTGAGYNIADILSAHPLNIDVAAPPFPGASKFTGAGLLQDNPDAAIHLVAASQVFVDGKAVGSVAPNITSPFTLEIWVQTISGITDFGLIGQTNGATTLGAFVYIAGNAGFGQVQLSINGGSIGGAPTNLTSGVTHVVCPFDGTNGSVYLNAALLAGPSAATFTQSGLFMIGQYGLPSGTYGTATVAWAALYSSALSASAIQNHYNVGLAYMVDRVFARTIGQAVNRASTF